MDLNALHSFLVVAEEMHMTRAAERLQTAQPNLTRTVRKLETELDFPLFDRSNKHHLELTPAGQVFLTQITPLLEQYEETVQIARRISQGGTGKLVIGYGLAAMLSGILPTMMQMYEHVPAVELVLRDLSTQSYKRQIKALKEHYVGMLFLLTPFDEPGIRHRRVGTTRLIVALPATHRLAHLDAISLADLAEEGWIWASRAVFPRIMDDAFQLCKQAGFEPKIVQTVPQAQAIISLVANGVGIAMLNKWAPLGIQQQGVVYRPLLNNTYQIELHVAWREQESSPLIQAFLQKMFALFCTSKEANGEKQEHEKGLPGQ